MKTIFLLAVASLLFASANAQTNEDIHNYINTYKNLAVSEMQRTGIPASITLAQGILESQAGLSDLTKQSNNHFGIKCKLEWTGNVVYHDDDEKNECFRVYACAADSYKDHSDFLKNRPYYSFLFQLDPTDYVGWAKGLKKAGYATEKDYPETLIKLIVDNHLQDYTMLAMQGKGQQNQTLSVSGAENNMQVETADTTTDSRSGDNDDQIVISYKKPASQKVDNVPVADPVENHSTYPSGIFSINNTKVIYASVGTSLFAVANNYNIEYVKLLDFNELDRSDILTQSKLIFLERKPKKGAKDFHLVLNNETLEDIAQKEGVRIEYLYTYNHLSKGDEPAAGEKVYLKYISPYSPKLSHNTYAASFNTGTK